MRHVTITETVCKVASAVDHKRSYLIFSGKHSAIIQLMQKEYS